MITIVDYKTGNLGSIKNMLKRIGEASTITGDVDEIRKSSKIILPGVGSFDAGVQKLKDSGIWDVLNEKILVDNIPILGICLGAQLMTQGSEEGQMAGFGWVDAKTMKFRIDQESKLKVPNMGWNSIIKEKDSLLFKDMVDNPRFYFVHSFHFEFEDKSQELSTSKYAYKFCSAFEKDNVIGVQFHPEKSHKSGMNLLKNFVLNY